MRFVSRSANLLVVLKPGLPAQPITGTPPTPTVSVRFKDGIADVPEGELADKMLAHNGFNNDFILADDTADPYKAERLSQEVKQVTTEFKYGTPVGRVGAEPVMDPRLKEIIQNEAVRMAKEMLPSMVSETLKQLSKSAPTEEVQTESPIVNEIPQPIGGVSSGTEDVAASGDVSLPEAPKKRMGRPPKSK